MKKGHKELRQVLRISDWTLQKRGFWICMTQGSFGSPVTPVTWDLMILKANEQDILFFVGGWGEIQTLKNWSHISFMNIWWRVWSYMYGEKVVALKFWWLRQQKTKWGKEKHLQHQRHSKKQTRHDDHWKQNPTRWTWFLFEFTFGAKRRDPWPSPFLFGFGGWWRKRERKKSTESTSPRRSMGLEYLPIYI